jgi:purine-binding chemotaxis protein CheW
MKDVSKTFSEAEVSEDTLSGRYLTFNIDNECYGIEIKFVTEIINMLPITAVPGLPAYMKGIVNLRGRIIPVMDIRLRFNKQSMEYNDRTCIIVAMIDNMDIGFIVDSVSEVMSIPDSDIVDPPNINRDSNRFIKGIGKVKEEIKLILDNQRLIDFRDIEDIASVINNEN